MKDAELRIEVARIEERLKEIESKINDFKLFINYHEDVSRKFYEVIKELGFSYDDNDVFDRNITNPESTFGRLQSQILALVESLELEEVWTNGVLTYRRTDKRRG